MLVKFDLRALKISGVAIENKRVNANKLFSCTVVGQRPMKSALLTALAVLLVSRPFFAQQPMTSQLLAYAPTNGSGLTLNLAAGTAFCNSAVVNYPGGTLTMAASVTSYVYLDPSAGCAPASTTTGFGPGAIPLCKVVTGPSSITNITDLRTMFATSPAPASGIASLNGLTPTSQAFATGTTGTDFSISSSGSTHTFSVPNASATARGLVTTGPQTFAGAKTFSTPIAPSSGGTGANNPATQGSYLRGNGTSFVPSSIAAGGAGACGVNQFVTKATDNAAPSCAQPAFSNIAGVAAGAQLPAASATAPGILQLARDLGGASAAPQVMGLQGNPVSNTAPAANQVLQWNGSAWVPATLSGGGGMGANQTLSNLSTPTSVNVDLKSAAMPAPSIVSATPANAPWGTLAPGTTYYFKVTGVDGGGGETAASAESSVAMPAQVSAPAAPVLTAVAGIGPAGTYLCSVTYVNAIGETTNSTDTTLAITATQGIQFTSPASATGVTGWNAYCSASGGDRTTEQAQNDPTSPLTIGSNFSVGTSGQPFTSGFQFTPLTNTTGGNSANLTLTGYALFYRIYRGTTAGGENVFEPGSGTAFGGPAVAGTPPASNTSVAFQQPLSGTSWGTGGGTVRGGSAVLKGPDPWIDVKAYGAKGDLKVFDDAAITSGTATLTSSTGFASFASTDVGKTVSVQGAGVGGAALTTTIVGFTNSTTVTLAVNASTTVSSAHAIWATDDTAAIQSAINACLVSGQGGIDAWGCTVFFPTGAYLVSQSLIVLDVNTTLQGVANPGAYNTNRGPSNINAVGAITILTLGSATLEQNSGFQIHNLALTDQNSIATGAIWVKAFDNFEIDNVYCAGFKVGFCVKLDGTNPTPGTAAVPAPSPNEVQFGIIRNLRAFNVKFGVQAVNVVSQITMIGGDLVSNGSTNGSIGLDLEAGTDEFETYGTAIINFQTGVKIAGVGTLPSHDNHIRGRIEINSGSLYHGAGTTGVLLTASGTPWPGTDSITYNNSVTNTELSGFATGVSIGSGVFRTKLETNGYQFNTANISDSGTNTIVLEASKDVSGGLNGSIKFPNSLKFGAAGNHLETAAANSDLSGTIALSGVTSASKTFSTPFLTAPACLVAPSSDLGTTRWWVTTSGTAVTVSTSSPSTANFTYVCLGNPN